MKTIINLHNIKPFFIENNKDYIYSKKGFINDKSSTHKNINLIDDYNNFYYLPEKRKSKNILYSILNLKTLSNNKFSNLKLKTNISSFNFDSSYKSIKRNPTLNKSDNKNLTILGANKTGFNVFYKGILGILPKNQILNSLKTSITYNNLLVKNESKIPTVANVKNTLIDIYFQNIRFNFSKTKKRRISLTETHFTFTNKNYEKPRKKDKTKNNE